MALTQLRKRAVYPLPFVRDRSLRRAFARFALSDGGAGSPSQVKSWLRFAYTYAGRLSSCLPIAESASST